MREKLATLVIELEAKIKAEIEAALIEIKHIDYKDQFLTFLIDDIEQLQKIHVESKYAEE